jgi:hypothetical protein
MQQMRQEQAGRPGTDNSNLGSHGGFLCFKPD